MELKWSFAGSFGRKFATIFPENTLEASFLYRLRG